MDVIVKHEVKRCRDCPHVDNNVWRHDCAFTSQPAKTYWDCTYKNGPDYIEDANKIDKKCPLKKKN